MCIYSQYFFRNLSRAGFTPVFKKPTRVYTRADLTAGSPVKDDPLMQTFLSLARLMPTAAVQDRPETAASTVNRPADVYTRHFE